MYTPSSRWSRGTLLAGLLAALLVISACTQAALSSDVTPTAAPGSGTPTVDATTLAAAAAAPAEGTGVGYNEQAGGGGGGKNIVRLTNRNNGKLSLKGNVQLNKIPGPTVEPVNLAFSYASCTDCQTLTVALQINLISRSANRVTPQNAAVAVNVECQNCRTGAWALQYVISTDDPNTVPENVAALIKEMDRELNAIHTSRNITLPEAVGRIQAVLDQFRALGADLRSQYAEEAQPTTPNVTPLPTGSVTPTVTGTPAMTGTPTATGTPAATSTPTVSGTPTESGTPTATPAPAGPASPSPSATPVPEAASPTPDTTPAVSPTATPAGEALPSGTPTATVTATATATTTVTATITATVTPAP